MCSVDALLRASSCYTFAPPDFFVPRRRPLRCADDGMSWAARRENATRRKRRELDGNLRDHVCFRLRGNYEADQHGASMSNISVLQP